MARLTAVALLALAIASVAEASPVRTCPSPCFCRHITPTVKKADCRDIPEWELKASDAQVVRIIPPPHPVPSAPFFLSRLDMFPKVQMFSVTNRSIIEVTSGNSPTLQVLDLSHNKISRFNERTFSHMPGLRQLNLAGNPISLKKGIRLLVSSSIRTLVLGYTGTSHIPNGSLSGIPNLTSLYLQGNPLDLQEGVALVDRISIQELDLSYCKLTKIPYHSLDNLVNLQRLYLKGNDLKTLFTEVLPSNLHHLDLSANRFRDVPIAALSALKNLSNLELAKNPVKCTCDVISFLDRLSEHNVIFEQMIVCAEPKKYVKVAWKDVDERELCKDDVTSEESADEDSRSTSMSFERDDVSYETDGPPEDENHILSQHPPPLSLQRLLQNSTRYQNMEENSIQSDQPYSNTSDEGTDHNNVATTIETALEKTDDDLVVASDAGATSTESFEGSEEKHEISKGKESFEGSEEKHEISKGKDDGLVIPAVLDTEKVGTDSHEEPLQDTERSAESKSTPRERENLEDEEEQKADLLKAPNASLELETPVTSSEESTEDPDSETFMRNEETIAMGKMMPESKDPPVILASHSEGQTGIQQESLFEAEGLHLVSTPGTTDESPQFDDKSQDESTGRVLSNSEAAETVIEETKVTTAVPSREETIAPIAEPSDLGTEAKGTTAEPAHLAEDIVSKEPSTSEEPRNTPTEHPGTVSMESKLDSEVTPHPIEEHITTVSEESMPSTSAAVPVDIGVSTEDHTEIAKKLSSNENSLEVFQETKPAVSSHFEEIAVDLVNHSDNKSEPIKADSASPDYESPDDHPKLDKIETQDGETTVLTTLDPSPDKVSSSLHGLFDDIDAQMASIYPDTPSTTERVERPVQTTPLAPETTTHQEESTNSFGFFPFNFLPKYESDKPPSVVSEPDSYPAQTSHSEDLSIENNEAQVSDDVVSEEGNVETATMAYAMIAGVIVCVIMAVACVSLRGRPDKKRKGSAPVRIRGDNVSPGTEMKDMMNPLLEPVTEGQTANEFHDDPSRHPTLNAQNGKFPVGSPVPKENGVPNGEPPQDPAEDDVTHVVIEPQPPQNGVSSVPVNGKPPRQNGTTKVKVVAGVIPPAIPRTPVYVKKNIGES